MQQRVDSRYVIPFQFVEIICHLINTVLKCDQ